MVKDTLGEMLDMQDENTGVGDLTLTTSGGGVDNDPDLEDDIQTQVEDEEDFSGDTTEHTADTAGPWKRATANSGALKARSQQRISSQAKEQIEYAKSEAMRRAKGEVGNSKRDQRSAANAIAAELSRLRNDMTSEEEKQQIRERIAQRNAHRFANVEHGLTVAAAIAINTPPRISATDRIFRRNAKQVTSQDEMVALFLERGCHIEFAGDFQPPIYWMESILEAIVKEQEADEEVPSSLNIPKPPPFKRSDALTDVWRNADGREIDKILAEGTFKELPIDPQGKYIEPLNAIHQRLLRVREWKWKNSHPETKLPGWCACVRIVIDGSKDLRTDSYYALCPDRVILFLLLAIAAVTGAELSTSDVERAYLN